MTTFGKKRRSLPVINSHCSTCVTLGCSVLHGVSSECLDEISAAKKCLSYVKGRRILMEGAKQDGVFFINAGQVKIYKSDKEGRQLILRFAKAGEILGFCSMDESGEQPVSAMALDDTIICHLDNKTFLKVISDNPKFALDLLKFYIEELREVENKSLKLAQMNVPSKVADALLTMHEAFGDSTNDHTLNLEMSRQDIADLAGTTKEQVSKALSHFRDEGIILTKGKKIGIRDLDLLRKRAHQ